MKRHRIQWLLSLLTPYRGWIVLGALLSGFTIWGNMGLLATSAVLLSQAALMPPLLWLMPLITGVRFFGIVRAVLRYAERLLNHSIAYRILGGLRVRIYKKLEALVPDRLMGYTKGMVFQRMLSDIDVLQYFYLRAVSLPLAFLLVMAAGGIFLFLFVPATILLLWCAMVVAGVVLPLLLRQLTRPMRQHLAENRIQLANQFLDHQHGLTDLIMHPKALARSQKKMTQRLIAFERLSFQTGCLSALGESSISLISHFALLGGLALAIPLVQTGALEGVYLAMVGMVIWAAFEAVQAMPQAVVQMSDSFEAAEDLRKIEAIESPIRPETWQSLRSSDLLLEDVSFRYHQAGELLLSGVSLHIPQGTHIAFAGQSGSGKTSLARIVAGLWQRDGGKMSFGGISYDHLPRQQLAHEIAYLAQSATVFHASVRENLLLANPKASEAELVAVLKAVKLWDNIEKMPLKLDTILSEDGSRLSGGERQRLAIARLLLRNPSVVILDEPTQNLDAQYVAEMMALLFSWAQSKTLILITHDLKYLEKVDFIYFMHHGKILERGSHQSLKRIPNGFYRRLHDMVMEQF